MKKEMYGLIVGLVAIFATACFFILGFSTQSWHIVWLVFLSIPITAVIMDLISKREDMYGSITGLVAVLAAVIYLLIGFGFDLWHPGWLVFLVIPITAVFLDIIKRKNISGAIMGFVAVFATAVFFVIGALFDQWHVIWIVFLLIPMSAIILNIIKTSKKDGKSE
ncbi:MAG: hypothetical protein ACOX8Q_06770 [Christensenellales bacterium]|jgi:hypothetical protein